MAYRVELTQSARRDLDSLLPEIFKRVDQRIRALALDPRPPGVKKMQGPGGLYRVRVGDYRIVYRIQDRILLVLIVKIGDRREVYRGL
ncbi:MAG: type II toxin-antitoxin system RelE/ParE family toxin [Planctomycetes bacterium]|nr:type II toxin-antitoxin system RelE/ParE family toxin [Planctomycetota bacterium]